MQQMRRLQHILAMALRTVALVVTCLGSISGCGVIELQGDLRKLRNDLGSLRSDHERLLIELSCKNQEVVDFLRECKDLLRGGESATCNRLNVEQTMRAMTKVGHVLARLPPGRQTLEPSKAKQAALRKLVGPGVMKSISEVLVVTKPQSDSVEHGNEADLLGRRMKQYLNEKYGVPGNRLFGPLRISCGSKAQMLDHYANQNPEDRPDFDEPRKNAPQVGIWVFRLDCGHVDAPRGDAPPRNPGS